MFAVLGDPTVFTDEEGFYVPTKHLHALLSVEQLFRRVFSSQTSHRDTNARRTLLFTILDTLERLTGRDLSCHCSLEFAQKILLGLKSQIPPGAAEVLLPGAERAVEALKRLQDGFFLSYRKGMPSIEWTEPNGAVRSLGHDAATAQYIKVLRDATHGHGTKNTKHIPRTNALLTHHNGHIPHDTGLLGYLYLLDLISRPDDLRRALYA